MIRKIITTLFSITILLFLVIRYPIYAVEYDCPSSEFDCPFNTCKSTCDKIQTKVGGPAGRGGSIPARCKCITKAETKTKKGTVSIGGTCTQNSDCANNGYCWGEMHQTLTCHSTTRAQSSGSGVSDICSTLGSTYKQKCLDCMKDTNRVWTAVGCLDTSSGGFVESIFQVGIGVAGGIALLLILFGALQIMTSAGNPEKLNAGKELVTAAITGLLFIIFSIFLLQIIGIKILGIPQFK